ncbi:hypothetical protein [Chryseomicrobium excrementi]|uniref:hypothetical protein n=1 Tax=Chryseomicrobium excrementi TaxID=2041346 RepID=UPI0013FD17AC|nr:hypothetical protein [Chryseomicrobium excrementi]
MNRVSKILMVVSLIAFLVASFYLFEVLIDRTTFYILLLIGGLALVFAGVFSRRAKQSL